MRTRTQSKEPGAFIKQEGDGLTSRLLRLGEAATPLRMTLSSTVSNADDYQKRLLRNPRREEECLRRGDPQGVPQAGAQVPSGRQSWRQGGRREVQGDL